MKRVMLGLFAVNPFGQKAYDPAREPLNFKLEPGQKVTLRHRVLLLAGPADAARLEAEYKGFVAQATP